VLSLVIPIPEPPVVKLLAFLDADGPATTAGGLGIGINHTGG